MYKQIIIVRKDLHMSPGKLAAQVSHASMAFLTNQIREKAEKAWDRESVQEYFDSIFGGFELGAIESLLPNPNKEGFSVNHPKLIYKATLEFDQDLFEKWINDSFAKVVLQAKNRGQLMKVTTMADALGLTEGKEYFLIKDNCHTELQPEETGEDGIGRTLTCIGFRPFQDSFIDQIGKKYHIYEG